MSGRFELGQATPARLQLAAEAARLAATGMASRQIAARLGCSYSYARELLTDPTGAKGRARKESYRGTCETCGASTSGCNGRSAAPKLCTVCHVEAIRADHGTRSRYDSGCSCEPCRRANREYMASLRGRPVPNHGTRSGYSNYGCRCADCREANRVYGWMHPEYQRRWQAKQKERRARELEAVSPTEGMRPSVG